MLMGRASRVEGVEAEVGVEVHFNFAASLPRCLTTEGLDTLQARRHHHLQFPSLPLG